MGKYLTDFSHNFMFLAITFLIPIKRYKGGNVETGKCGGLDTFSMGMFSASTINPGSKDRMNATYKFTVF